MDPAAQVPAPIVDSNIVGRAFVSQYYHIMYNMPELLHRFYQEMSKIGRVGQDGVMRVFSTLQGISEELKTLTSGDFKSAKVTSYDTQESHSGGFLLVVTGYFILNERFRKKFTQTFFLAPQENGYFVLNDILRFVNEPHAIGAKPVSGKESQTHTPINAPTSNQGSEEAAYVSVKEESNPLNIENASVAKEQVLVPEVVKKEVPDIGITCNEAADDLVKMSDTNDDVPKKSYASVLKVTRDKSGVSSQYPKQIPKDQDHQVSWDPSPDQIPKEEDHQASWDPFPNEIPKDQDHQTSSVIESDAVSEGFNATEHGHNQVVAEGTSVYVRHLPTNATIDMLETEFKQFGAISSNGVQVVSQRGCGFPFGFVEFEEADAAQRAIEASPVIIGGQRAFVEEKRSTGKGNRGSGNRNVGGRGRGSYGYRRGGGRSFSRTSYEYVSGIDDNTY